MAVAALTSWSCSLVRSHMCSSACPKCSRKFSRSEHHRRLLTLHKSLFHTFSCGSLRCVSPGCRDNHQVLQWQGWEKCTRGNRGSPGIKLQAFCIVTENIVGGSLFTTSSDQSVRRLILLRHAKSSWSDRSIKDHERPLSRRGRQAASNIALKLQDCAGWEPQLILCSDSTRTRQTLEIMQQQLPEFLEGEVRYFSSFYSVAAMDGQTVQHLQEIICQYSKKDVTTIMCMGHNRGWEEAASLLSGVNVELKTANAALLETRGSSWEEAFEKAGLGGWKLIAVVKPDPIIVEGVVQ